MNALPTLRSLPSLLYFFLIGLVLTWTIGIYDPWGILFLSVGFSVFTLTFLLSVANPYKTLPSRTGLLFILLSMLVFSVATARHPNILYPQSRLLYFYFQTFLKISGFLLGLFVLLQLRKPLTEKAARSWFLLFLAVLFYLRFFVLSLSPEPHIDVFTSGSLGADYLLSGLNPYSQNYPDIYGGGYNYASGFFYGPVYLYLITPFRLLHDIRLATIASDLLTVTALWRIGALREWNMATRCNLILLWLLFPVSLFVLEQAWIDPLMVAALAWAFCFFLQNKMTALGIALGLVCGIKHYGVIPSLFILLQVMQQRGFKAALQPACWAATVLLVAHSPFLLLDPHSLIQSIWTNVMATPPREDALTLWAWAWNSFDITPIKSATLAISSFLIGLIIWRTWNSAPTLGNLTRGMVLSMSILFLLGYQAFCNYYYFLAFLVLLDFAFSLKSGPTKDLENSRAPIKA